MSRWSVCLDRSSRDRGPLRAPVGAGAQEFVITESLGYLVNRAARSMAHQLAQELRPAGIGIGQWAVLLPLWARDGLSQAELSRVVAIEPPTMVRTIDRMARDGLVTRVPDRHDGRLTRIYLTERGRSLRDELIPKAIAVNTATLARLTPAEGRTLRRLLRKLVSQPDP
jgi:MarR family transcriptional regulator for hemolysin